jgi:hypothetical protein
MGDRELVRYTSFVYDSERWQGFELRADDIIISTPPKCGTTWTQMICALLILQTPELDQPLAVHSPWLDMQSRARRDVVADLDAQRHRRFIKTHTPLDGLPLHPTATYICVGRDPRDVALSMDNHMANIDFEAFAAARAEAAAIDGVELAPMQAPPSPPASDRERFWLWVDNETPPSQSGSSLLRTLRHFESFWDAPPDLDVVMLHYDDLKADLDGQMRMLADRLGIGVPADSWDELVTAASFDRMRASASTTAPRAGTRSLWRDEVRFFNRGTSGQWRDLLADEDVRRYQARVAQLVSPELAAWAHHES